MYSGSDSTESANYGQWPLNPAFFQNMPNEQVDWAALAQQWIQMKEAGPPLPEPKLPNNNSEVKETPLVQKEVLPPVIPEDNVANAPWNSVTNSIESQDSSWNWKTQQNWEWGNPAWNPHLSTAPVVNPPSKTTLLPITKGYSSIDAPKETSTTSTGYTSVKSSEFGSSYSGQSAPNHSRNYKPHNRRYSKVNIPKTNTTSPSPAVNIPQISEIETSNLDANKRKQLPAWIREGLEKMEKDKLKQMEREKEKEKQTLFSEKVKEHEKEAMEILKDTINERRRSKFDSDDEHSPRPIEEKEDPEPLNYDDLIILVRRTMTEILLKVTNEAIHSICTEERQRYMKKTQSLGKVTGKTNVKAKLGLGMYGSDSGSESDNSDSSTKDSDDELKNSIRKRKAEFVQTEKGIEDKLQQAEKDKDSKKTKDEEEENSSENNVEEYTPEKKKDEGVTKNKDTNSKHRRSSSRSSDESDDESSHRKSSSSRESSSSTRRRHRNRSKGRGFTPEKRKKHKSKRSRSRSHDRRHSSDYKYKKDRNRSDRSRRSRSRTSRSSRRSRSRSSSYRSRRSPDRSSRSKRKRSRSPYYSSRSSKRSRSRSRGRSSRR
ncbi:arginine/serine-rich protein PNISR [Coccinella septempunctata]|uniref:arginine/serine-rich protein PNISR n=1 Tax=Coccinella septempunctata TaxID=41139 RepID=UPI001D068CC4|nr:arginine/serine-rich protein PNISR [Coccinella septempunctata]